MEKNTLLEIKKRLLALGLSGVMLGNASCSSNKEEDKVPKQVSISSEYSNVDNYYKYVMQNGKAVKVYNNLNVYLLFDKETYEVSEYIYYRRNILSGMGSHVELYDLPSENMLVYSDGINKSYNEEYYKYLMENNYQVCLTDIGGYVEGHTAKKYYSLDDIRDLEPQIAQSLKNVDSTKVKTK